MTHTDTDGLFNACAQCGARAGHEESGGKTRGRCTECCNTGDWDAEVYVAAIRWNMTQMAIISGEVAQ